MKVTEHFDSTEFDCHDGTKYPKEWVASRLKPLCMWLEELRAWLGSKPITVVSGYRTPAYNRKIGGAKGSLHMQGLAADIKVKGVSPAKVAQVADILQSDGLGLYAPPKHTPGWVHVDRRRVLGMRRARWTQK